MQGNCIIAMLGDMNLKNLKRIALVGNPNVGKSSLFYRLTGTHVITGNFPGTTLTVTRGSLVTREAGPHAYEIIDMPGLYSLSTQEIAAGTLFAINQADVIINVIDTLQLKRNLYLHMQLQALGKPLIVALNFSDEARYHGISTDIKLLSTKLCLPVLPIAATTGFGVHALIKALSQEFSTLPSATQPKTPQWKTITALVESVQTRQLRGKTALEYFSSLSLHPVAGPLIALGIFGSAMALLLKISMLLEGGALWVFTQWLQPPLLMFNQLLTGTALLQKVLIGTIGPDGIDFQQAMGLLTTGLYVPLGQVAPPVIAFYTLMGLLEDSGYLPRLAYLADRLMHHYALHGIATIPMLLGAGCNVTGIIGTRLLEHRAQRIIAATLIAIAIPCASQTGFIVAMAPHMGVRLTIALFITLISVWHITGLILGRQRGRNFPEMILELPPLRRPKIRATLRKITARTKNFLKDAIPITIVGIGFLLVLTHTGLLDMIGQRLFGWLRPLWGLPASVVPALCMGLFRKEIALTFLKGLPGLSATESFTTTLLLTLWFPCVSVYAILYKEFGLKTLLKMVLFMCCISTCVGALAHILLSACTSP